MRRGSLCTGIAGLELLLPGTPAWHAEVESAPCALLERRFPGVPNLGDVRTVDWNDVEPVDLLVAGPPCQPISQAGQRKGPEDTRWLWDDVWRAVRTLRPRYLFLENPPGVFRWLGEVLGGLAEVGGYRGRWDVFRAADVGAPHRRARVFLFAADTECRRLQRRGGPDVVPGSPGTTESTGHQRQWHGGPAGDGGQAPADSAGSGRGALGDAISQDSGGAGGQPRPLGEPRGCVGVGSNANASGLEGPEPAERHDVPAWGRYELAVRRWEHRFRPAPSPLDDRGRLSADFVTWMMGLPAGWTEGMKRTHALKALGNAVVPQVAALAWEVLTRKETPKRPLFAADRSDEADPSTAAGDAA